MIREVNLVSYLPPFMQDCRETVAALEAENPEFMIMWKAVDRLLYNRFIETADEYGISRFEKMLGIRSSVKETLEGRRLRVRSRWFDKIPYTTRALLQKLTVLCADTDFYLSDNFNAGYTLAIKTGLELYGQVDELERMLDAMIPCNIAVETTNEIVSHAACSVYMGGGVGFAQDICI